MAATTPIFKLFKLQELVEIVIDELDAKSIIQLGKVCKEFRWIPGFAWNGKEIFSQFADRNEELRHEIDRTRATATGEALVGFFSRRRRVECLNLTILVNYNQYVMELRRFFLSEGYQSVEGPSDPKLYPMAYRLTKWRGSRKRSVTIMQCHGSSELQVVLMADTTGEAVTLTSNRAVCMYPLLGLEHQCAYWFGGRQSQTNAIGLKRVTSHLLPGQNPLAKVLRTELGRERSLGDKQCFIIPLGTNRGRRSGWTIQIQPQGMVTWIDNRLGLISGNWYKARRTIAIIERSRHHGGIVLDSAFLEPNKYEATEVDETLVSKE